jgi:hypothetical protein
MYPPECTSMEAFANEISFTFIKTFFYGGTSRSPWSQRKTQKYDFLGPSHMPYAAWSAQRHSTEKRCGRRKRRRRKRSNGAWEWGKIGELHGSCWLGSCTVGILRKVHMTRSLILWEMIILWEIIRGSLVSSNRGQGRQGRKYSS